MNAEPNCSSLLGLRLYADIPPLPVGEVKKEGSWNVLVAAPDWLLPELGCMSSPANMYIQKIVDKFYKKAHCWILHSKDIARKSGEVLMHISVRNFGCLVEIKGQRCSFLW